MKKRIIQLFLFVLIIMTLVFAYKYYLNHKEEQRRAEFYDNLSPSASPTVSVLRDSILIAYQDKKRTIHIYVPPEYSRDTTRRFPVMYFLDGESSFDDMENMGPEWQIDEVINAASENGKRTAIVVGINQAENRDAEYTPFVNEDNPEAHGDKFAEWCVTDLKNWIDSNYRTLSGVKNTTIGGISRSGMMAYYMIMKHPNVFGNAIIQSPAMWVDYDRLLAMKLPKSQLKEKKLFISVGENEGRIMIPHARAIYDKFKTDELGENQLRFEIIPKEGHWHVTWRKSFAIAYPWLME